MCMQDLTLCSAQNGLGSSACRTQLHLQSRAVAVRIQLSNELEKTSLIIAVTELQPAPEEMVVYWPFRTNGFRNDQSWVRLH